MPSRESAFNFFSKYLPENLKPQQGHLQKLKLPRLLNPPVESQNYGSTGGGGYKTSKNCLKPTVPESELHLNIAIE